MEERLRTDGYAVQPSGWEEGDQILEQDLPQGYKVIHIKGTLQEQDFPTDIQAEIVWDPARVEIVDQQINTYSGASSTDEAKTQSYIGQGYKELPGTRVRDAGGYYEHRYFVRPKAS